MAKSRLQWARSQHFRNGIRMKDGTELPAEVIVYATGYRPMHELVGSGLA